MSIREDFKSVDMLLNRLLQYAAAFNTNNVRDWPHLKNNEDFKEVYKLEWSLKGPLEHIYTEGRDISVFMSLKLHEFNCAEINPTLKVFVDSFNGGWLYQIDILKSNSQYAKDTYQKLENTPWAIPQMIKLYDSQIELLIAVKHTIEALKETDLYKWEGGSCNNLSLCLSTTKFLNVFIQLARCLSGFQAPMLEKMRKHCAITS